MKNSKVQTPAQFWGRHKEVDIYKFRLENNSGAYIELSNYGATIISINVPDKNNRVSNVILNYPNLSNYIHDPYYLGTTIGRFANRIGHGRFSLNDEEFILENNDQGNTNHGGINGFNKRIFRATQEKDAVSFHLISQDGDGGYPGNLDFTVRYTWSENNELLICYTASTDKPTIANFTNHAYFNLSDNTPSILDHELIIMAENMLEFGPNFIPTGKINNVCNMGFQGERIREKMNTMDPSFKGYNQYFIFDSKNNTDIKGRVFDKDTGRLMDIYTSYPGVLLYTGDLLSTDPKGNGTNIHPPFSGLCLECQYYPDSPNHSNFPSTLLRKGEQYNEFIKLQFRVKK